MQRLPVLGCSKFGTRNGGHRLDRITIKSTHGIKPLCPIYLVSRNVLRVCCFTIHDMIYATLHTHCSVLRQKRHSGFDASELTQGFGIEPYVVLAGYPLHGLVVIK